MGTCVRSNAAWMGLKQWETNSCFLLLSLHLNEDFERLKKLQPMSRSGWCLFHLEGQSIELSTQCTDSQIHFFNGLVSSKNKISAVMAWAPVWDPMLLEWVSNNERPTPAPCSHPFIWMRILKDWRNSNQCQSIRYESSWCLFHLEGQSIELSTQCTDAWLWWSDKGKQWHNIVCQFFLVTVNSLTIT
jgi:hypothetical protein